MTHDNLVKIAEKWLLKTKGCGFAFAELCAFTNNGETPDAVGWRSRITILVECKTNRSDFHADKNKKFRKQPHKGMGSFRFYMCPEGVIQPEDLPDKWGLVWVNKKGKARQVVGPKGNTWKKTPDFYFSKKCEQSETAMMYSALRRLHLRGVLSMIYESPF